MGQAYGVSIRTSTSPPAATPGAVGEDDDRVGGRRRRQLMAALGADRPHVEAPVVGERAVRPHEVGLAVGLAPEVDVGDADHAACGR